MSDILEKYFEVIYKGRGHVPSIIKRLKEKNIDPKEKTKFLLEKSFAMNLHRGTHFRRYSFDNGYVSFVAENIDQHIKKSSFVLITKRENEIFLDNMFSLHVQNEKEKSGCRIMIIPEQETFNIVFSLLSKDYHEKEVKDFKDYRKIFVNYPSFIDLADFFKGIEFEVDDVSRVFIGQADTYLGNVIQIRVMLKNKENGKIYEEKLFHISPNIYLGLTQPKIVFLRELDHKLEEKKKEYTSFSEYEVR